MNSESRLSVVIPVYNSAETIRSVVTELIHTLGATLFEIVLVNDGSRDETDTVCRALANEFHPRIKYLELGRNFSEHNAVLAGLSVSGGEFVAVVDDDGQQDPVSIWQLLAEAEKGYDVVYGVYRTKHHAWWRNVGSALNSWLASFFLGTSRGLYLSSFKVMRRQLVKALLSFPTPYPYIDGLIAQLTSKVAQVEVPHRESFLPRSRYNLRKLVRLFLNMLLSFSVFPLRVATYLGIFLFIGGGMLGAVVVFEKLKNPNLPVGYASLIVSVLLIGGLLSLLLGVIGEYVGRIFMVVHHKPQYWIRSQEDGASNTR